MSVSLFSLTKVGESTRQGPIVCMSKRNSAFPINGQMVQPCDGQRDATKSIISLLW